mmetsp:Transcript_49137/g.118094  ORF Transcript_49137/g.118094 Transcript_49137/m.118094 type:complete len:204 (+) Transcript_49137:54-665(+)
MHVYGERSSGSKDKDRGVPKNTFRVVTKNTFLTVEGIEGVEGGVGDGLKEKPNSAPASLSSASDQSLSSNDVCSEPSASSDAYNRPEGLCDTDVPPGLHGNTGAAGHDGNSNPSKKDATRSNKQHRIRYRKLAAKLEEQVKADPLGVDLASLNLPPFVESDSWLRDKLLRRLRSLREDTLAAAGSRSKNTSRAASSGPLKMSL